MGILGGYLFYKAEKKHKIDKNKDFYNKDLYTPGGIELIKLNPGLQNFGNTCFANSMIQGLSSCTNFI